MRLLPVRSSNIKQLGWLDNTLHVEFSNGGLFSYANVSEDEYNKLLKAKSIGAHFAQYVRNKYKSTKL